VSGSISNPVTTRSSETEVYSSATPPGPSQAAELDLSAVVGKQKTLVFLKVFAYGNHSAKNVKFYPSDDGVSTFDVVYGCTDLKFPASAAHAFGYVTVTTNVNGKVMWVTNVNDERIIINVKGFINLL
jgi:hypothetical protein